MTSTTSRTLLACGALWLFTLPGCHHRRVRAPSVDSDRPTAAVHDDDVSRGEFEPSTAAAPNATTTQSPPTGAPANFEDPFAGYRVLRETEYGKALFGEKPHANAVGAALRSAMDDVSQHFEKKATVRRAYEDTRDHRAGGAMFVAQWRGQPFKGLAMVKLDKGGAKVVVVYARAGTSHADWMKLLGLPAGSAQPETSPAPPAPGSPQAAGGPVALSRYSFADGTGIVGLARGWHTASQTCADTVLISGPADQSVVLGIYYSMVTPDSPTNRGGRLPPALFVGRFSDPLEAIRNLAPQISRRLAERGGPAIALNDLTALPGARPLISGIGATVISYGLTETTRNGARHYRVIASVSTKMIAPGSWSVYVADELKAPDATFDRDLPTMQAIAESWRIDANAISRKGSARIAEQDQWFRSWQAQQHAREVSNRQQIEGMERSSTERLRGADDADEVIRGYRTLEDTQTGERTSVDLGNVDGIVDSLNKYDPGRYQQIPLRDEAHPLDDR